MLKYKEGFMKDNVSDIDYLGFRPYINAFSYLLNECDTILETPFVFGIHGKWGSGKSTFMNLLTKEINSDKFVVVNINPWKYKRNEDFIYVFALELCKSIEGDRGITSINQNSLNFLKRLSSSIKLKSGPVEINIDKIVNGTGGTIEDDEFNQYEEIKETVAKYIKSTAYAEKKIILFIDDLDRCDVSTVINVLESIKLTLNLKECYYFLGCDKEFLKKAIITYYDKYIEGNSYIDKNNAGDIFAKEYLEKIVQLPFYIPSIERNNINEFIKLSIDEGYKGIEWNTTFENENFYERYKVGLDSEMLSDFFYNINVNSRFIKRTLMMIYMNSLFIAAKGEKEIEFNLVALLTIISELDVTSYKSLTQENFQLLCNTEVDNASVKQKFTDDVLTILDIFIKNTSKDKLVDLFKNYNKYLNVTNVDNDSGNLDSIFDIRSDIGTGKNVKNFVKRFMKNQSLVQFLKWFFEEIYNEDIFLLGIYKEINLYLNKDGKVNTNLLICKIRYDAFTKEVIFDFSYNKIMSVNGEYKNIIVKGDADEKRIEVKEIFDSFINEIKKDF